MKSYDDSSKHPAPTSASAKKAPKSSYPMRRPESKKSMGSKTPSGMDLKFQGRVKEATSAKKAKPARKRAAG